jgi:hypothetical protein
MTQTTGVQGNRRNQPWKDKDPKISREVPLKPSWRPQHCFPEAAPTAKPGRQGLQKEIRGGPAERCPAGAVFPGNSSKQLKPRIISKVSFHKANFILRTDFTLRWEDSVSLRLPWLFQPSPWSLK